MNPNDNYDELSEFDRDFISEAMVFVPLVEKSSKRIENPRLVDAVAQAERETRAIEEKSKAIRAQHTSTTTASPVGEIVLPNYGGECLPFKSPTKEPMETYNWQPITPETLPDNDSSVLIILKKEGEVGQKRNRFLIAHTEYKMDGFGRLMPLWFKTEYFDVPFSDILAWHPLPDAPSGLFK